ncbi:hypothetical protein ABLE91_09420 [Aquabacter sp. CN5-332]|uniref:hypothetical protein n=1 Tax=Aquabacter sp. CN5-332 TaxID=3156608 RepID=UPI0032B55C99
MDLSVSITPDGALAIKTALRVVHFIGLVLGLGAATLLDIIIIRFIVRRRISGDYCDIIDFSSKIVSAGLVFLWISGIGFLLFYGLLEPAKLGNEKVWAKIAIVGVLTLNGLFLHHFVLPLIRQNIGKSLFAGMSRAQARVALASGVVSGTSWYVPLLLGCIPQLNFVVPAWMILSAYAAFLMGGIVLAQGIAHLATAPHRHPPQQDPAPDVVMELGQTVG